MWVDLVSSLCHKLRIVGFTLKKLMDKKISGIKWLIGSKLNPLIKGLESGQLYLLFM